MTVFSAIRLSSAEIRGGSFMHNPWHLMAVWLQPFSTLAQPMASDNGSVWSHMSDALHQSLYRVLALLIAVLPGLLAFFVAFILFTALGMGISALLRRALVWVR